MALDICGIVGVTRPNVILGRNLRRGSGTVHTGRGKQLSIINYGYYWSGSWNGQPALCAHF